MKIDNQFKEINLYGLEIEYINSKYLYSKITNLWKSLNKLKAKNNIKLFYPWSKYGVIYKRDNVYYYFVGSEVFEDDNVDEFINFKISVNDYLKYEYQGNMIGLKQYYKNLFLELKNDNVLYCKNPLLIELYTSKFGWNSKGSIIDIIIPVMKSK